MLNVILSRFSLWRFSALYSGSPFAPKDLRGVDLLKTVSAETLLPHITNTFHKFAGHFQVTTSNT